MNIIFFFIILIFIFNYINKKIPNNNNNFINILDKYKNIHIIKNTIDYNIINKIKINFIKLLNDNENYKYYYDILEDDINNIENNIINKKKVVLLSEQDNIYINNFLNDLYSILSLCKNKKNQKLDINRNKSLLEIKKVKEYNKNIYI